MGVFLPPSLSFSFASHLLLALFSREATKVNLIPTGVIVLKFRIKGQNKEEFGFNIEQIFGLAVYK